MKIKEKMQNLQLPQDSCVDLDVVKMKRIYPFLGRNGYRLNEFKLYEIIFCLFGIENCKEIDWISKTMAINNSMGVKNLETLYGNLCKSKLLRMSKVRCVMMGGTLLMSDPMLSYPHRFGYIFRESLCSELAVKSIQRVASLIFPEIFKWDRGSSTTLTRVEKMKASGDEVAAEKRIVTHSYPYVTGGSVGNVMSYKGTPNYVSIATLFRSLIESRLYGNQESYKVNINVNSLSSQSMVFGFDFNPTSLTRNNKKIQSFTSKIDSNGSVFVEVSLFDLSYLNLPDDCLLKDCSVFLAFRLLYDTVDHGRHVYEYFGVRVGDKECNKKSLDLDERNTIFSFSSLEDLELGKVKVGHEPSNFGLLGQILTDNGTLFRMKTGDIKMQKSQNDLGLVEPSNRTFFSRGPNPSTKRLSEKLGFVCPPVLGEVMQSNCFLLFMEQHAPQVLKIKEGNIIFSTSILPGSYVFSDAGDGHIIGGYFFMMKFGKRYCSVIVEVTDDGKMDQETILDSCLSLNALINKVNKRIESGTLRAVFNHDFLHAGPNAKDKHPAQSISTLSTTTFSRALSSNDFLNFVADAVSDDEIKILPTGTRMILNRAKRELLPKLGVNSINGEILSEISKSSISAILFGVGFIVPQRYIKSMLRYKLPHIASERSIDIFSTAGEYPYLYGYALLSPDDGIIYPQHVDIKNGVPDSHIVTVGWFNPKTTDMGPIVDGSPDKFTMTVPNITTGKNQDSVKRILDVAPGTVLSKILIKYIKEFSDTCLMNNWGIEVDMGNNVKLKTQIQTKKYEKEGVWR
jgi:hypothetical protein